MNRLDKLLHKAKAEGAKRLAVAAAEDDVVLKAVSEATNLGIVKATLYGNEEKIRFIANENCISLEKMKIIPCEGESVAALEAVKAVKEGKQDFIMKGKLNTADLLKHVLNKDYGIRKAEVLSHVMVYDVPTYQKLIFLTDGGMITFPELKDKVGIVNNAVQLCRALDISKPKVAALAAIEGVNPKMTSTLDAAALSMMAKRGQIKGCIIDGPLALDNAINKEAAEHKGIVSEVAGDADILLVPNMECGNMLGKSLTYFARGINAGVIMGAKCPVVLVSRSDSAESKLYSIALGAII